MPSIRKNNRAAQLLAEIREEDGLSLDRLALLADVTAADIRACQEYERALPALAQIRLSRAIASWVPRLALSARRLEDQATAAARIESGVNTVHLTAPARWR